LSRGPYSYVPFAPIHFYFTPFCMNSSSLSVERAIDVVCDLADHSLGRGRPWRAWLTSSIFLPCARTQNRARANPPPLASFSGRPDLVMGLQMDGCRPSGAPRRFTGSTDGRGSSLFFSPPMSPSDLFLLVRDTFQSLSCSID
jgi:hypothetical protein